MRMLLIEDMPSGQTTMIGLLSPYGTVRAARSIVEAESIMASGWNPEVVVADLNLGDRRKWQDSFADVVRLANGRPIAAQTADVWHELREEFGRLFSGQAQLFAKGFEGTRGLIEWLQQFREDQSGRMVQTMDRGSQQSHADIRAEFWLLMRSLGAPHSEEVPVEAWARDLVRCIVRWQRRAGTAGTITWQWLVGLVLGGIGTWLSKVAGLW